MAKVTEIEITELPGVGPATAEKLVDAGYSTMMKIATAPVGDICELTGMSKLPVLKLLDAARNLCNLGFRTAKVEEKTRERVFHLKTGSKELDKMLEGGFESGSITECYGEFGSAKTQIAHQLAVNVQREPYNGMCIYIDTEGSFRPQRIREIAKAHNMSGDKVLENIKYAKSYSTDHQMLLAEKAEKLILEDKLPIKLLIVDSLTSAFRAEYLGRGALAERQQKLNKHMQQLSKLGDIYNVVVYVTNQVSVDPGQMFGDPTKSIGGHIVGHNSMFRIYLRKGKKGSRVGKLVDAPHLPDAEASFMITYKGIRDVR